MAVGSFGVGHGQLAGFTAPIVCERLAVELLVLLSAMTPRPGESAGEWWTSTGHAQARQDQADRDGRVLDEDPDLLEAFFHDVPPDVRAAAMEQGEVEQSATPFVKPWPLDRWPSVPTRFLQARDDRFFPVELQRRLVKERLGIDIDEMPGGHLVALSRPAELVERLEAYRTEV